MHQLQVLVVEILGAATPDGDPHGWWANLLQGLLGNLVATAVACLASTWTALFVFRRTLQEDARKAVRDQEEQTLRSRQEFERQARARQAKEEQEAGVRAAREVHEDLLRWLDSFYDCLRNQDFAPLGNEFNRLAMRVGRDVGPIRDDELKEQVAAEVRRIAGYLMTWITFLPDRGFLGSTAFEESGRAMTESITGVLESLAKYANGDGFVSVFRQAAPAGV